MIKRLFILLIVIVSVAKQTKAQCSITVNTSTICAGQQTATLTASGATNYTWMPGGINSSTLVVSPNVTTIYTVTGTTGTCTAINTTTVVANPLPMPIATSNTPCATEANLNLTCTPFGMANYSWVGPNSFTSAIQNPTIPISNVTAAAAGIYTVTVTDVNTCTNTTTVNATVNPRPVVNVNSPTVCVGQTINLSATGGFSSYSWSGVVFFTSAQQNPSITNATTAMSGNYAVTVTDANGCINGKTAEVVVNPLPYIYISDTIICPGSTTTLTAHGANTYTWSTGANTSSIVPLVAGSYSVLGTDMNGCLDSTTTDIVNVGCTGISQISGLNSNISIYPNPATTSLQVSLAGNSEGSTLVITDMLGNTVKQITTSPLPPSKGETVTIDVSNLNEGVYNISISHKEGTINKRVVIVK